MAKRRLAITEASTKDNRKDAEKGKVKAIAKPKQETIRPYQKKRNNILSKFKVCTNKLIQHRKNPILVMFYCSEGEGKIFPWDLALLEKEFQHYCDCRRISKIDKLDLIIYTRGGDANTSYRLAQLIRGYVNHLHVIIPEFAYSGGTLIAFAGNCVEMGVTSVLSPIDVQITDNKDKGISLLGFEKFVEFIADSSAVFHLEEQEKAHFATELMKCLVEQATPLELGEIYRLRSMTKYHAETLLANYMFGNDANKAAIIHNVIGAFTKNAPSHSFDMDYNLVKATGIKVKPMDSKTYKLSKSLIELCVKLADEGLICKYPQAQLKVRAPYFGIFDRKDM
ncbi:MAG TPA: hypothetical protein HA362_00420 [Nanoarchaeota archaeon]|nr:hypothetical protein [Nanoarchaeota archaeon]